MYAHSYYARSVDNSGQRNVMLLCANSVSYPYRTLILIFFSLSVAKLQNNSETYFRNWRKNQCSEYNRGYKLIQLSLYSRFFKCLPIELSVIIIHFLQVWLVCSITFLLSRHVSASSMPTSWRLTKKSSQGHDCRDTGVLQEVKKVGQKFGMSKSLLYIGP